MTNNKINPWSILLRDLHGEFNPLLGGSSRHGKDHFFGDLVNPEEEQWSPRVDIKEEPEKFIITADLPGISNKDLEIYLENNVLSIKGTRTLERDIKKENYSRIERFSGSFYRQFTLPDHVSTDHIKANCKHGVLEIVIPKKERHVPKKIAVHSNNQE